MLIAKKFLANFVQNLNFEMKIDYSYSSTWKQWVSNLEKFSFFEFFYLLECFRDLIQTLFLVSGKDVFSLYCIFEDKKRIRMIKKKLVLRLDFNNNVDTN